MTAVEQSPVNIKEEMLGCIPALQNFELGVLSKPAHELSENPSRRVDFVGIGSSHNSILHARKRAMELSLESRMGFYQADEYNSKRTNPDSVVILSTNSGNTHEIVDRILPGLLERNIECYAVCGNNEVDDKRPKIAGMLAPDNIYYLHGDYERTDPANKSVLNQMIVYDAFIHAIAKREFELGKGKDLTSQVVDQILYNFNRVIDERIMQAALRYNTIHFMGHDASLGNELGLKSYEIAKKPAVYWQGTKILHGPFAGIGSGDLILLFNLDLYTREDLAKLWKQASTNAPVIATFEPQDFGIPSLEAKTTKGFEAYSLLPSGWNLLCKVGLAKGHDINYLHTNGLEKSRQE